jgi:serine/threonine protein kinase
MDVEAIADAGACDVVRAEVRCACLVSELVRTGVCPNFVETFQVLGTSFEPSEALWGSSERRAPRGGLTPEAIRWAESPCDDAELQRTLPAPDAIASDEAALAAYDANAVDTGVFQLARMELCSGGDVEEHLRRIEPLLEAVESAEQEDASAREAGLPDSPLPVDQWYMGVSPSSRVSDSGAIGLAAQLLLSLLAARDRLTMRHWDVKLLNCLLMPADAVRPAPVLSAASPAPSSLVAEQDPSLSVVSGAGTRPTASGMPAVDTLNLRYHVGPCPQAAKLASLSSPPPPAILDVVLARSGKASTPPAWAKSPQATAASSFSSCAPAASARKQLAALPGHVLKLADFGTADTRDSSIGHGLRARHFTTIENASPDMLLLGDAATQDFAADTWAAGLCVLHLLTGACPYEEVLEEVHCPGPLRSALEAVWRSPPAGSNSTTGKKKKTTEGRSQKTPTKQSQYECLSPVLREDEEGVVADTMVRLLVLFGFPKTDDETEDVSETQSQHRSVPGHLSADADGAGACQDACAPASFAEGSPVFAVLRKWLLPQAKAEPRPQRGRARRGRAAATKPIKLGAEQSEVRAWFARQQQLYNVWCGAAPLMKRARRRMAAVPGAAALLWRLCQFDPELRPSAREALSSYAAFAALRDSGAVPASALPAGSGLVEMCALGSLSRSDA